MEARKGQYTGPLHAVDHPMLTVATLSHPGSVRTNNEDSVLWNQDIGLLAVADGMGGHNAGEVASQLALQVLHEHLKSTSEARHIPWLFGYDPSVSFTANRLLTAVRLANQEVHRAASEREDYQGMGTTIVAALVEDAHLTFVSVGDSRLYEMREGQVRQLTRDDSWLEKLAETPGVSREQVEQHPLSSILTAVVGPRPELELGVQEIDLTPSHTLVLCSDGLYRMVTPALMHAVLTSAPDVEHAAEQLVQKALELDGKDNITVLVARYSA